MKISHMGIQDASHACAPEEHRLNGMAFPQDGMVFRISRTAILPIRIFLEQGMRIAQFRFLLPNLLFQLRNPCTVTTQLLQKLVVVDSCRPAFRTIQCADNNTGAHGLQEGTSIAGNRLAPEGCDIGLLLVDARRHLAGIPGRRLRFSHEPIQNANAHGVQTAFRRS